MRAIWCTALLTATAWAQPMTQGDGVWLRNAYFGEAQTFDACGGHQPQSGQYHHHAAPVCLREQLNDNVERIADRRTGPVFREKPAPWTHSPILGWAFDGYPIYGPYAYADPRDPRSAVRRLRSGFRLRGITQRTTLPPWAQPLHAGVNPELTAAQYGPPINAAFPLGRYLEDYEWADGHGDLDVYNGRFAVTPEYPQGTYAYHVTIEADGTPAFPYIFAAQYYGAVTGGNAREVPAGLAEGVTGQTSALITSWATRNAAQPARVISAFNPSAGPRDTWPLDVPEGARTQGGVTAPVNADIQRIRYSDSLVYINANGLPSYPMGAWFDALQGGGVFAGQPTAQNVQAQFPRSPAAATTRRNVGLGAQGYWVNGVAVYNVLDGASYSQARGTDVGGGLVGLAAVHVSAASFEQGPLVPGSFATAFPLFGLTFASPESAVVRVRDSAGVTRNAAVSFASPGQINYRLPADTAIGYGTVTVASGGVEITGNINVRDTYLSLFSSASVVSSATESVLVLYGTGMGRATSATATVGGANADVLFAGAQSEFPGLDQINVRLPRDARGRLKVVVNAGGRLSNTVEVDVR